MDKTQQELDRAEKKSRRKLETAVALWLSRHTLKGSDAPSGLLDTIETTVQKISKDAWEAGNRSARRELLAISEQLGQRIKPALSTPDVERIAERASQVAEDYAARYEAILEHDAEVKQAIEAGETVLERAVVSESVSSFNEARATSIQDSLTKADVESGAVVRVWMCDGGQCDYCGDLEGSIADLDGSFSHGEEPGHVHPNCHCSDRYELAGKKMKDSKIDKAKPDMKVKPKQPKQNEKPNENRKLRRAKEAEDRKAARLAGKKKKGLSVRAHIPPGGHLSIRHMAEKTVHLGTCELSSEEVSDDTVTMGDSPTKRVWTQVAIPGRYFKDGTFFEMNAKTFSDIVANFNASINKRVPCDFEHASEMPGSMGSIPSQGAPAQGWIVALDARPDGLWACVEWGDLARSYIKEQKYRFVSPAIRFGCRDMHSGKEIGAKLTSVALTNIPFLDGLAQVAAKQSMTDSTTPTNINMSMAYSTNEYMPAIRQSLRLSEMATPTECMSELSRLREHYDASGKDMSMHQGIDLSSYMLPMRDMVRPPMGASWDDVFDVVTDLISDAIDEHGADDAEDADYQGTGESAENMTDKPASVEALTTSAGCIATQTRDESMNETELAVQLKGLQLSKDTLELQAKEFEVKLKAASDEVIALKAENEALKAVEAARKEADFAAEIDTVILTYKDTKGLTEAQKPALLRLLKADAEGFRAVYPKVEADKQHLLRDIATKTDGAPITKVEAPAVIGKKADMKETIQKLMSEDKTLTNEQAVSKAFALVTSKG